MPLKRGAPHLQVRLSLPSPTYRFRVQRPTGECSQDWRVWVQGAEVYLAPRCVGHQYKASFHASGQCQVGLSSDVRESLIADPHWEGKSRLFDTWQTSSIFTGDERAVLLELLIPGSYLDAVDLKPGKKVELLPCPDAHLVSICLVKSSVSSIALLTSPDISFRELARLPCTNACTLSVLYRVLPETDKYHNYLRHRYWSHQLAEPTPAGRAFGSRVAAPIPPTVRALLWDGRAEPKQWHEVSARKLHASGPPSAEPRAPSGEA